MNRRTHRKDATRRRRRWRRIGLALLLVLVLLGIVRAILPGVVQRYVNRTLDRSQGYDGRVGDVDLYLYRGAYRIQDVRIVQTIETAPVPLFDARQVDLAIQWSALLDGEVVGRIAIDQPRLNFVDAPDDTNQQDQTGAGGPWLQMISDLFPFTINSAVVHDGAIHFQALGGENPVDVYLSEVNGEVRNLTNVREQVTPLVTTVEATALAMDQARLEYHMELNPFSYRPTFRMTTRLLGLDVTRLNDLTRRYGAFDFERGWFDLVVEVESQEGALSGYVKPLFRNLKVLSLRDDLQEDDALRVFWEALVGGAEFLLRNQPRDQFGTVIPFSGNITDPDAAILATIGNLLRNAFIRAYLPRLQGGGSVTDDDLEFSPPSVVEPGL